MRGGILDSMVERSVAAANFVLLRLCWVSWGWVWMDNEAPRVVWGEKTKMKNGGCVGICSFVDILILAYTALIVLDEVE